MSWTSPDIATVADGITVYDGKYTVIQKPNGGLEALRYGEPWRDCTGDGLILALAQEIESLRTQAAEAPASADSVDRLRNCKELHPAGIRRLFREIDNLRAALRSSDGAATTPEPLSLQAVREDERLACWKIAEEERHSASVDKAAWLVAFDIANQIKMRGMPSVAQAKSEAGK